MNPIDRSSFRTDDDRWEALGRRDPRASGAFVYAVRTTGIYCRPACRSRRPNRANVAFFDDAEGAERAGFRPCKRCGPGAPDVDAGRALAIARACSKIREAGPIPTLAELASEAGLSPGHLHRAFKKAVGVTPKEFAMGLRAGRLRAELAGSRTVADAILGAGFGSIGRAYDGSSDDLGMTPGESRGGGVGRSIRYATAETTLGWVVVGATDRGACWIELGDSPEALTARLVARFPKAELAADDPELAGRLRQVVALVDAPGSGADLPLDVRGTAFQRRVWAALREIPVGSTATYAEVARAIGSPTSARAVARACASNELAVVIPCHRVVRGDGALGGYRWGVDRKRALLDGESKRSGEGD